MHAEKENLHFPNPMQGLKESSRIKCSLHALIQGSFFSMGRSWLQFYATLSLVIRSLCAKLRSWSLHPLHMEYWFRLSVSCHMPCMSMLQSIRHRPWRGPSEACNDDSIHGQQKKNRILSRPRVCGLFFSHLKTRRHLLHLVGPLRLTTLPATFALLLLQTKPKPGRPMYVRPQLSVKLTSPCHPNVLFRGSRTHEFRR